MALWFKCRVCTARFTDDLGMGVGTILRCPSCGVSNPEHCEGLDGRPTQSPLFQLPAVPRPCRWKIEWRWTPAVIQNTQDLFGEVLPDAWFFHSEYSTERQAINSVARLRRNFGREAKHYRSRPCLWNHFGDIELVLPEKPKETMKTVDYAAIDALIYEAESQMIAQAATFLNKSIDPAKLGPYCGTDYCDDPACLTHGDKPTKSQMSETEVYDATFQSLYLEPHCGPDFCVKDGCPIHGTPDPWDEKQIVSPLVTKT